MIVVVFLSGQETPQSWLCYLTEINMLSIAFNHIRMIQVSAPRGQVRIGVDYGRIL